MCVLRSVVDGGELEAVRRHASDDYVGPGRKAISRNGLGFGVTPSIERARRIVDNFGARLSSESIAFTLGVPGLETVAIGTGAPKAHVQFVSPTAAGVLESLDPLALAESFLRGDVDIAGDFGEIARLHSILGSRASLLDKVAFAIRMKVRDRVALNRESVAFHYDRPAEFFLPWFERWRSYSHGFYNSSEDRSDEAQARKFQYAIDSLGLRPGDHVLDVGGGWGSFLGIRRSPRYPRARIDDLADAMSVRVRSYSAKRVAMPGRVGGLL